LAGKWCFRAYDDEMTEDEFAAHISKLAHKCKRVVVILDSCHSGMFKVRESNVVVIAACKAEETAIFLSTKPGYDPLCSVFHMALLEGLGGAADANGDGIITLAELDSFFHRRVAEIFN